MQNNEKMHSSLSFKGHLTKAPFCKENGAYSAYNDTTKGCKFNKTE
ncbi:MAG: hypothetical protein AB1485_08315 [Candidatus Thermoplasmatota archaeon]